MRSIGEKGEHLAAEYLKRRGYRILAQNWRGGKEIKAPEIDIIAEKDGTIAFVEVKALSSAGWGEAEYRVTWAKRRRLAEAAKAYLALLPAQQMCCRFDVVIIDFQKRPAEIRQIQNAFTVDWQEDD